MDLFKAKLVTYTIASGLIISACLAGGLYLLMPNFERNWFVATVVFFLIIESLIITFAASKSRTGEQKMVNIYMMTKVFKVIASLIFISVYALSVKTGIKGFILIFMVFYVLYLIAETILFIRIEKHIIEEKKNNNE
jgi:hypothetical protein